MRRLTVKGFRVKEVHRPGKTALLCIRFDGEIDDEDDSLLVSEQDIEAAVYRGTLAALGLTQYAAANLLGIHLRTSQKYANGERRIPRVVISEIWNWWWYIERQPEEERLLLLTTLWQLARSKQEPLPRKALLRRGLRLDRMTYTLRGLSVFTKL